VALLGAACLEVKALFLENTTFKRKKSSTREVKTFISEDTTFGLDSLDCPGQCLP